jgi:hypothetical protein
MHQILDNMEMRKISQFILQLEKLTTMRVADFWIDSRRETAFSVYSMFLFTPRMNVL